LLVAFAGGELPWKQNLLFQYYFKRGFLEELVKTIHKPSVQDSLKQLKFNPELLGRDILNLQKTICAVFMKAVDEHDRETILSLADAVWRFRDVGKQEFCGDWERAKLILLKHSLQLTGKTMTLREVAEWGKEGKKASTPADGFSALRRKCKEIDFPLAESRKRRAK
jgi:hypothetical protein